MSSDPALRRRLIARFPMIFALGEAVGLGFQAIRAYKMRAFLTILGVVMGIMTVTGMSAIVAGLNASMAKQRTCPPTRGGAAKASPRRRSRPSPRAA